MGVFVILGFIRFERRVKKLHRHVAVQPIHSVIQILRIGCKIVLSPRRRVRPRNLNIEVRPFHRSAVLRRRRRRKPRSYHSHSRSLLRILRK